MYRIGRPGWKLAAWLGMNLLVKIDVVRDREAGVFVATSSDLPGLVVEATSMEALFPEVYDCVGMLLAGQLKHALKRRPVAAWDGDFSAA